ncbi:hypothetical protein CF319_g837 [Tilletia indica]|nr:hypothetical protein CF319_g837 [Tilletia indica]KAE8232494.1 hypothetical protein CF326_g2471 [Tilletia indica]
MPFKLLFSLFALAGAASAVTTGPYEIGSGHYSNSFEDDGTFSLSQGQSTAVVNQAIACNVAGSGISLNNAPFQFQATSYVPTRANDSSVLIFGGTSIRIGVPSSVTDYFSKAGASSLTVNNDTVLSIQYIGYNNSETLKSRRNTTSTVQLTGASYTNASLGFFDIGPLSASKSAGLLTRIPSRRLIYKRDQLTFSLSAAGKTANVTCPAGAYPQNFGALNVANLPLRPNPNITAVISFVRTGTMNPGSPPLNSTSVVSDYRPVCTFTGIGKQTIEISLGGYKLNTPISTSTPAVFSLGQSNFWISQGLISFFQNKYPSTNAVSLTLSAFNVSISNATPSIKNLLPSGGYPASAASGNGSAITFPSAAPSTTYPSATFTPLASSIGKGQFAILSFDNLAGSFKLLDSDSAAITTVSFSCSEGAGNFPAIVPFSIA